MSNDSFDYVDEGTVKLMNDVRAKYFPELANAKIMVLFSQKKMKHLNQIVMGKMTCTNDLVQLLTEDDAPSSGYDYIVILDKLCWENIKPADRERLMRHELRHTLLAEKEDETVYGLRDHDITDFVAEVKLNTDDPDWRQRVAMLTSDLYEQKAEMEKEAKKKHKDRD